MTLRHLSFRLAYGNRRPEPWAGTGLPRKGSARPDLAPNWDIGAGRGPPRPHPKPPTRSRGRHWPAHEQASPRLRASPRTGSSRAWNATSSSGRTDPARSPATCPRRLLPAMPVRLVRILREARSFSSLRIVWLSGDWAVWFRAGAGRRCSSSANRDERDNQRISIDSSPGWPTTSRTYHWTEDRPKAIRVGASRGGYGRRFAFRRRRSRHLSSGRPVTRGTAKEP